MRNVSVLDVLAHIAVQQILKIRQKMGLIWISVCLVYQQRILIDVVVTSTSYLRLLCFQKYQTV